jgi:26S proteasome regulatory subunit N1
MRRGRLLQEPHARFLPLALGLVYLGKQQHAEVGGCVYREAQPRWLTGYGRVWQVALATLQTLPGPSGKIAQVVVETCAYAGIATREGFSFAQSCRGLTAGRVPLAATGNVLKIQHLLHLCSEHFDTEKEGASQDDVHQVCFEVGTLSHLLVVPLTWFRVQGYAVVGIAMIAMGEEISTEMALRTMDHLLQYGEPVIRRYGDWRRERGGWGRGSETLGNWEVEALRWALSVLCEG